MNINKVRDCLCVLCMLMIQISTAFAQTVQFQRFPAGAVSSVDPRGPATTLTDLAANLSNARMGGVENNGAGLTFYADRASDQILAVDTLGNIYVILLPFSGVSNPQAISLDLAGNFLYVADTGNNRIVRVNLSLPLPAQRVQVVLEAGAGFTDSVSDLKYNPSDGHLYWTNSGTLHRARVAKQPMPVQSGETVLTNNSIEVRFFDFDLGSPQTIFFSSGSGGFEGIYSSHLPRVGDSPNLVEVRILDTSATPDVTTTGIAIDKGGPFFCYTATNPALAPAMRCGDRTTTSVVNFSEILSSEFTVPPNYMVFDTPSTVVRPNTQLSAPIVQLSLALPKPAASILLKPFESALPRAERLAALEGVAARVRSGKIGFRYVVEIDKTGNSTGKSFPQAQIDRRRAVSKRNVVTARNLKPNSTYQVRYSIEITRKLRGQPEEVVKKTRLSPISRFVVPRR